MRVKFGPCHLVQYHALISYNFPTEAPFSNLIGVMPLVEIQMVCRKNPGVIVNTIRLSTLWGIQTLYRDCMEFKIITLDIIFRNQLSLYM